MAIHLSDLGIIRCATPTDAQALSRLMAAHGTEALPLTAADLAAWRARGPLLVLELADGSLGGVASVTPAAMRDDVRYLAVHPALGRRGIRTLLAHCRGERTRSAFAIFVSAALALIRPARLPRAIVCRRRARPAHSH
jgi:hypothetical protein